jgi:hypothetical protein
VTGWLMRRQERVRAILVTTEADPEEIEPRKGLCWAWPTVLVTPQATLGGALEARADLRPGVRAHLEHNIMFDTQQGKTTVRPPKAANTAFSPKSQECGRDPGKSSGSHTTVLSIFTLPFCSAYGTRWKKLRCCTHRPSSQDSWPAVSQTLCLRLFYTGICYKDSCTLN